MPISETAYEEMTKDIFSVDSSTRKDSMKLLDEWLTAEAIMENRKLGLPDYDGLIEKDIREYLEAGGEKLLAKYR